MRGKHVQVRHDCFFFYFRLREKWREFFKPIVLCKNAKLITFRRSVANKNQSDMLHIAFTEKVYRIGESFIS